MLPVPAGFGGQSGFAGPASSDVLTSLRPVRWCVIGLWVCFFVRLVIQGPFNTISTLMSAMTGTYLLMNDERLRGCYALIYSTPLSICGVGGLQCALPFMFITALNSIFDLIVFFTLISFASTPVEIVLTIAIGSTVAFQLIGLYITYKTVKPIIAGNAANPGFTVANTGNVPTQYVSIETTARQPLFTGTAHRLGE